VNLQLNKVQCITAASCSREGITYDDGAAESGHKSGYVCHHIRKKIEASIHPLKKDMVLCLMTMVKEKSDTTSGLCEEWTNLVDRGRLWHIRENTHSFFLCLEEVHVHLQSLLTETNKKQKIIQELIDNENV